jgi:uncharacterized protein YjiS (DUF1127 family)
MSGMMRMNQSLPRRPVSAAPRSRRKEWGIARLVRKLELALQVRRERRMLLGMDERMLKDLGLNGIAQAEASRPFWDVPSDRLRGQGARRRLRATVP